MDLESGGHQHRFKTSYSQWGLIRAPKKKNEHTRGGTRTRNLLLRREAPYPLGHASFPVDCGVIAPPWKKTNGLREPAKKSATSLRHIYTKMWRSRVSIPVPPACEAGALPFELHPHVILSPRQGHQSRLSVPSGFLGNAHHQIFGE